RAQGSAPRPGPVRDLFAGPATPIIALSGELMVVSIQTLSRRPLMRSIGQLWILGVACVLAVSTSGCAAGAETTKKIVWDPFYWFTPPEVPPPPEESLVLRGDQIEPEKKPVEGSVAARLAGAHELYRRGDLATAERAFHFLAENVKNGPQVVE